MIHSFCSNLREPICYPNTQSGSRSPLKQLSESREEVAVLEQVLGACLLPYGVSWSPGLPKRLPSCFWEPGSCFWSCFPRLYKVRLFSPSYQSQPTTGKSPESLHIDETMVGLSLALVSRARSKSKTTALFKLSGSSQQFNLSYYFIQA